MRNRIITLAATAVLTLSACGGGGGGGGGDQTKVADKLLEEANAQDIVLDGACVKELAGKLSDDDAKKILNEEDPSPEGEAIGAQMFSCADTDAIVDQVIEQMGDTEGLDADCLKDALKDLDPAEMEAGSPAFAEAMTKCITIGG